MGRSTCTAASAVLDKHSETASKRVTAAPRGDDSITKGQWRGSEKAVESEIEVVDQLMRCPPLHERVSVKGSARALSYRICFNGGVSLEAIALYAVPDSLVKSSVADRKDEERARIGLASAYLRFKQGVANECDG